MASLQNKVQYFMKGAVEGFSDLFAPFQNFALGVREDAATYGDIVKVDFVSAVSSSTDWAGTYTGNGLSIKGVDVTLNIRKFYPFQLDNTEAKKTSLETLVMSGRRMGAQLCADFMSASLAATVTAGNFSTTSTYASPSYTSSVAPLTLMKQCDDLKMPSQNRVLVTGTDVYYNMLTNTAFQQAYAYGNPTPVQQGKLPEVFGFTPFKVTHAIPGKGFAAHPSALAFAFAPNTPDPALTRAGVLSEAYIDENTGLVLVYRQWADPNYDRINSIVEVLGGASAVNPSGLIRIAS